MLTWKCASRHNGVHFFDISTSESGPSDNGVLCTFWLSHVLRATTACTISTSQLPKVVRSWCVLYILTWKCASRHNGVQFFISHLASWLRTRRFSEPSFRPSGATNHWKNSVSRLSYLFTHLHLLSSDSFPSTLLSSNLSLLSASSLLCFSSVHIVRSLTSKLPSMIMVYYGILWCTVPWGCLFSQIYLIYVQRGTARTCFLVSIHSKSAPHHSWLTWPKVTDWWLQKNVPPQRWRNLESASQKNVHHHNYHHYLIASIDWSSLSWLVDQPWWSMGSEKYSSTNHDAIIIGHKTDQKNIEEFTEIKVSEFTIPMMRVGIRARMVEKCCTNPLVNILYKKLWKITMFNR